MRLSGWGRFPVLESRLAVPRDEAALAGAVARGGSIARGAGRAYGDSAVSLRQTIDMRHFDRMLSFDDRRGRLVAEAGVRLSDVVAAFLPRGWFPAVTPGTKHVTLGGMIAADVHGKNHHRDGGMSACLDWIELMGPDGRVTRCAPGDDLFGWTLGGMGLTGVILRAALRLRRVETGWIAQTTIPAPGLEAAMDAFEAAQDATYSVAWIDCLGRGAALGRSLVMLGEHACRDALGWRERADPFALRPRRRLSVPIDAPGFLLGGPTVRAFNRAYYALGCRRSGDGLVGWDGYFYPLDAIRGWNRIYGAAGFMQFQCVLPLDAARDGLRALLEEISGAGTGSFLAVLKRLGPQGGGVSFPMPGYTLALDFPVTPRTRALAERLDRIVIDHGGRFYLAKDSRMSAETLAESDPRAAEFAAMRGASGLDAAFRSVQSERLAL